MGIKVIITGTTGMVGQGVLLECLENERVENVLVVNRSSINLQHPKLKEIIHPDFFDLKPIDQFFVGYDVCFFCLGVSSAGMKEEPYRKITYDLTLNFAKVVLAANPSSSFIYVSGEGTDSTEKGWSMWARVKGKTENDLLSMPFRSAFMFRPGFIYASRGEKSRTKLYNTLYVFIKPLYPLLKLLFPSVVTTTENMGKAMINVVLHGFEKKILVTNDINKAAIIKTVE